MLNFIVSTAAFSLAAFGLNRLLANQPGRALAPNGFIVLVVATLVSIGAGWVVDELDGDADKPHPSISQVIHSGDPVLITKTLIGIN